MKKQKSGMSIIEMTISIAIIAVLSLVLERFYMVNFLSYEKNKVRFELTDQAIRGLNYLNPELRGATQIENCSADSISLLYIRGDETIPEKITFTLDYDTHNLSRSRILPSGSPPNIVYDESTAESKIISEHLVNSDEKPLLKFFNEDGGELTEPCDASEVRLVGIDMRHQSFGHYSPVNEIITQTKIQLRNKKENL